MTQNKLILFLCLQDQQGGDWEREGGVSVFVVVFCWGGGEGHCLIGCWTAGASLRVKTAAVLPDGLKARKEVEGSFVCVCVEAKQVLAASERRKTKII